MKFSEICEKLKSGEITLDNQGHRTNSTVDRVIKIYEETIANSLGAKDGKWNYSSDEDKSVVDEQMRNSAIEDLSYDMQEGKVPYGLRFCMRDHYCFECGNKYSYVLFGNKLVLCHWYDPNKKRTKKDIFGTHGDFVINPLDFRCEFEEQKPITGSIRVTNDLLFTNYFTSIEDCDDDNKHSNEYSLNCTAGRKRITSYKEKKNVAYGQMSNMSIGVYINKNKDSVIIGPSYHPAEYSDYLMTDEEYEEASNKPVFDGYELKGTICLDVWRWEAADINTVSSEAETIKQSKDYVQLDVRHGIWDFEQRFRCEDLDDEDYKYAILKLRK